jgi:hypothetical protein
MESVSDLPAERAEEGGHGIRDANAGRALNELWVHASISSCIPSHDATLRELCDVR